MKAIEILLSALPALLLSSAFAADRLETASIGDAQIFYNFQTTETGVAILTQIALVSETNNSLRGLKNTDRRRLSKLGQLIYQCKLMLYRPDGSAPALDARDPVLISKNFSLFTGVDLSLAPGERLGIQAQALQAVDNDSLFTPTLGKGNTQRGMWETLGDGSAISLRQLNVNFFEDSDLIETSESVDINLRFPIFQLEKPVYQWSYNFNLKDFKQAVRQVDENCTPGSLTALIKQKT